MESLTLQHQQFFGCNSRSFFMLHMNIHKLVQRLLINRRDIWFVNECDIVYIFDFIEFQALCKGYCDHLEDEMTMTGVQNVAS